MAGCIDSGLLNAGSAAFRHHVAFSRFVDHRVAFSFMYLPSNYFRSLLKTFYLKGFFHIKCLSADSI